MTCQKQFRANVVEEKEISQHPSYHGWPTLTRCRSGELMVVCSAGRKWHVCPFGQVHLIRSTDNGQTWSAPEIIVDGPIDDRDAGVLETQNGIILVNWFSSAEWVKHLDMMFAHDAFRNNENLINECRRMAKDVTPEILRNELGGWMISSCDNGKTWSPKYRTPVNSPHGPVQLRDGRLLYAGKKTAVPDGENFQPFDDVIGVAQSCDDGKTWQWLGEIQPMAGHSISDYHELHAVEASDGTLIVHIRCEDKTKYTDEVLQAESSDGGRSWSLPHSIDSWGVPSFLMKLNDGNLMFTYSYRRSPCGNKARLSTDNGQTWSNAITISASGGDYWDLGYPSTVELDDGSFITVWYQWNPQKGYSTLRQAHWYLEN